MKKFAVFICLIGSLLMFLDAVNFGHVLLLLLFAGVIPGTNTVISPIDTMAATATAITVIVLRITVWPSLKPMILPPVQRSKKSLRRAA